MVRQLNFYYINTGSSQLKTESHKYGRDTPLLAFHPIPVSHSRTNTEIGGINIEILAGQDGILSVRFHP